MTLCNSRGCCLCPRLPHTQRLLCLSGVGRSAGTAFSPEQGISPKVSSYFFKGFKTSNNFMPCSQVGFNFWGLYHGVRTIPETRYRVLEENQLLCEICLKKKKIRKLWGVLLDQLLLWSLKRLCTLSGIMLDTAEHFRILLPSTEVHYAFPKCVKR